MFNLENSTVVTIEATSEKNLFYKKSCAAENRIHCYREDGNGGTYLSQSWRKAVLSEA